MTKKKLLELIAADDYGKVVSAVSVKQTPKTENPLDEYNVERHPIFNKAKRPDVDIKNKDGQLTGKREVTRIGLAFEKLISGTAAAFLCANPVVYKASPLTPAEENMWAAFKKVNEKNKLDYKNHSILEMRMSETEVAEIWYLEDTDQDDDYWSGTDVNAKKKLRLFLSSSSLLDVIWPVWDAQDNMIAFGREYVEVVDEKDIKHFDLYTAEKIYEGVQDGSSWTMTPKDNEANKIVVIYHAQKDVEWADVRTAIRRLESIMSDLGDSNFKTAFPILFIEGDIASLPQGPSQRIMKGKAGAKANYLSYDNLPASQKLEIDNLLKFIYSLTNTPDISLDNLKGIGNTSGFAIQLMFLGAHLKASKHAGTFGECVQRRINLIKKICSIIDPSLKDGMSLTITPQFDLFLPKDLEGMINFLSTATGSKPILSQESAVNYLQGAMGGEGDTELDLIKGEASAQPPVAEGLNL
jgi:hypothetical protein